jgi:hypothetical protein
LATYLVYDDSPFSPRRSAICPPHARLATEATGRPSSPTRPEPNVVKSPAPAIVVQCWCGLVERMDCRSRKSPRCRTTVPRDPWPVVGCITTYSVCASGAGTLYERLAWLPPVKRTDGFRTTGRHQSWSLEPGTYAVTVRREGSREWTRADVRVARDRCSNVQQAELRVRLQ